MHPRRLACFLLGIWLGGILMVNYVARRNLNQVNSILNPEQATARIALKELNPGPNAVLLLRYQAAEENRGYYSAWTAAQIGLGIFLLIAFVFSRSGSRSLMGGMLFMILVCALEQFLTVREMSATGRMLDFLPADQGMGERGRLWVLQTAYYATEGAKALVLVLLGAGMFFSRGRERRSRDSLHELNRVYKPDYRGVNR